MRKKQSVFLTVLMYLLGTGMFYYNLGGLQAGPVNIMTKYIYALGICCIGFFCFLVRPEIERMGRVAADGIVLALPYCLPVLFSMVIWIWHNSPVSYMTRGFSFSAYQILALITSIAYLAILGKRAIYVQLASMATANALMVYFRTIQENGFQVFLEDYVDLIISFGARVGDAMQGLEIHDLTFAIGLCLLYFLLKSGKVPRRVPCIAVALIFFTTGLKRIAVAAVLCALLVSWILKAMPEKGARQVIRILGYVLIAVAILYIAAVKFGLYEAVVEYFGIDTKGRVELNHYIDSYYSFSPLFGGEGLGFVSRFFGTEEMLRRTPAGALHNDFLRMYVEIGFCGYLIWLWLFLGYRFRYFCKKCCFDVVLIAFATCLYCYVTYLTDNTYYYFYTNMAAFTLILSCEYESSRPAITESEEYG